MRSFSLGVALAAVAVASPLSAQTWQAIGTPNNTNTGAYWNNRSDDNVGSAVCNVGAILTNTPALTAGSCSNQAPVYIPLNPAPLTTSSFFLGGAAGSNPGGFGFNCVVACSVNLLGRVAGNTNTSWGVVTSGGSVFTAAQLAGGATVSGTFAVWITQALPMAGAGTIFTSGQSTFAGGVFTANSNQQFAAFSATALSTTAGVFGTIINVGQGRVYVGMEDNVNGGRGFGPAGAGFPSDRDYNDILVSIQAVPEPATIGLMGFGLLALAGIAKRRKA
ncbi:MAG TPA: PEP-CTERM sorting domain-containing protein [Gemmatimonadaceae bacterium]|nr:PEP-CTERM sorting domain-containing protein [Gemmatimonadaceae bacterium]